ncbi:MAG: hypothetical protein JJE51_12045 [Thermoanaerobaculia bacterium]|nr:hypothetical protein [Thermoanaerobaculia bacterium]
MFGKKKTPPSGPPCVVLRCSFCNKSQNDVKKLIAGLDVQICDECIDICLGILNEEKKDQLWSSAVEGHIQPAGRAWPLPGTLLFCGLCRTATTLDQSLAVPDRGIICTGCVGALEAALAERNELT